MPLPDLPNAATLYSALVARDAAYEGRAFVGVTTTGIFCRLTCPARKPRPENCRWFADPGAALAAGFRPCLRCVPVGSTAAADRSVARLWPLLQSDPARRWCEADLRAMGLDPSTVRRSFRRQFGLSFLQMARLARLGQGVTSVKRGARMIDAQLDSGFDSAAGFRAAFARLFGHSPRQLRGAGALSADWIELPLGGMIVIADDTHLHLLEFVDRKALPDGLRRLSALVGERIGLGRTPVTDRVEEWLSAYFDGRGEGPAIALKLHGTPFQERVWRQLLTIPPGETRSYRALAEEIGRPTAVRAIAGANAANRLALIVPCHRVIGSDGSMTGYAGGLWRKERLIRLEQDYRNARQRAGRGDCGVDEALPSM